jgi:hypothetical protein
VTSIAFTSDKAVMKEADPTQRREIRAGDAASRDDLLFMLPPSQFLLVRLDSRQRRVLDRY